MDHYFKHGYSAQCSQKVPKGLEGFLRPGLPSRLDRLLSPDKIQDWRGRRTGLKTQRGCSKIYESPTRKGP